MKRAITNHDACNQCWLHIYPSKNYLVVKERLSVQGVPLSSAAAHQSH